MAKLAGFTTNNPLPAPPVELGILSNWNFDEADNTAVDAGGLSNGTWVSPELQLDPLLADGGKSVACNGSSTRMTAPHVVGWLTPTYTFRINIQPDTLPALGTNRIILDKDTGLPPGGISLELFNSAGTGKIRFYARNATGGGGSATFVGGSGGVGTIVAGTAYLIVVTYDGVNGRIYVDKTLLATTPLSHGLDTNTSKISVGAYNGTTAFFDGVVDKLVFRSDVLDQTAINALPNAVTITHGTPAATGIVLPQFEFQQHSDAVPGGAIWWDPTSGSDGNNGSSKALAKATFTAAQTAVSAGGTIVVAGGGVGTTTYHSVPQITPTKSGTAGNPITMMSEPDRKVVLIPSSEAVFLGALTRTWTWTQVDASLKTWDSPALGIGDGATTVSISSNLASGSNWLTGWIKIPNGARGRPHYMQLPYVATADMNNPDTGNKAEVSYAHPWIASLGNGKLRIRMMKPTVNYAGNEWPTDGVMGGLIDGTGKWAEPATENPNDYEIHIVRWGGDFGTNGPNMFVFSNVNYWTFKGINGALCNRWSTASNSGNIIWDRCTGYANWAVTRFFDGTANHTYRKCIFIAGDVRHMDWSTLKNGGYYYQHMRSTPLFSNSTSTSNRAHNDVLWEDCTFFGFFDGCLPSRDGGKVTYDHCAMLNNVDDGCQVVTNGNFELVIRYCYWCGVLGGEEGGSGTDGGVKWTYHHNIIDNRIPILWAAYANTTRVTKVAMNLTFTGHGSTSTSPVKPRNFCYNTIIASPGGRSDNFWGFEPGPSIEGKNITSGLIHNVFNNIWALRTSRRYPTGNDGDPVSGHMSCLQSAAGWQRFDFNCYDRTGVPGLTDPAFLSVQDSKPVNRVSYTSLAAFRASAHKTTSLSMYTDGTDGHEASGVQVDPGFVNLAALDYRPTHASVITGAKDVTALIGGSFENWKGALNPAGDGSEVGPRP